MHEQFIKKARGKTLNKNMRFINSHAHVTVLFGDSKIVDLILENAERKCISVLE